MTRAHHSKEHVIPHELHVIAVRIALCYNMHNYVMWSIGIADYKALIKH